MTTSNNGYENDSERIRVLVVDDHPLFRDGLQKTLDMEDDIVVVGQCSDGEAALELARQLTPDVIVLDVNLPSMNGLLVARHLRASRTDIAIVVLTAYHDNQQLVHAMRSGASAYCPKDIMPDELVHIIRVVADGFYVVADRTLTVHEIAAWLTAEIERLGGSYIVDADEHFIPLSPREMEILQFVTNGMSNKEIAYRLRISQQTVKNHMTSILKKLNVEDRTQAAVTALRHGWVRLDMKD
ncbi:MAG: response regulator transcription factor [Chloroflexi bacterium]|nr:response regulator transcription factor [Chloroflexota bacterium]